MIRKIKILIYTAFAMCCFTNMQAQTWHGSISHNGYNCSLLKTANNITVYAAKGNDGNRQALFIKIKVPYNWGNTGTGCIKYFKENLFTGDTDSQSGYFHYNSGWLYFTEYLSDWCSGNDRRGNCPCNNYTFTLYEKNDHGNSGGNKIAVNLNLNLLNTAQMPLNKIAFETYW